MKSKTIPSLKLSIKVLLGLILLFIIFTKWLVISERFYSPSVATAHCKNSSFNTENKQKGAHVYGRFHEPNFQFLTRNNIEWATIVAWSSQDDYNGAIVGHHNGDSALIKSSDSIFLSQLHLIHKAGFKIFVKPHVWITNASDGKWRSDVFPTNDENWKLWKKSYRDYILRYALLSEQANVEMFCIGTEFSRLSIEKPTFWKGLIQEVRSIYAGKLTYAANWYDEYEKITFWEDLDYIGIQAYFPLVKNENPSVKQLSEGWNKYLSTMKAISRKYNRKILFTELGYKSTSDSAVKPWEWAEHSSDKSFSAETQANCYQAFFETVWTKKWFAGVHFWVLRNDYKERMEFDKLDFSPLDKSAEQVMARGFE